MTVDNDIMLHLERKAALSLIDADRSQLTNEINAVLSCLDVLRTCPAPAPQMEQTACPLRADEVCPSTDRAALLANAPETDGDFFLVPRTVE